MSKMMPDFPPEYDFLVHCCVAITRDDYKTALQSLKKGLARNLEQCNQVNGVELMRHLQAVICVLERHLRQSYGYEWEQQVKIPSEVGQPKVLRCSFCGKLEGEVAKVIVGPAVSICNECVGICNEVLKDAAAAASCSGDRA